MLELQFAMRRAARIAFVVERGHHKSDLLDQDVVQHSILSSSSLHACCVSCNSRYRGRERHSLGNIGQCRERNGICSQLGANAVRGCRDRDERNLMQEVAEEMPSCSPEEMPSCSLAADHSSLASLKLRCSL